jgi:hypothetical protein
VSPKFNEGGGVRNEIKTHAILNGPDLIPENLNGPGSIPDPPGRSGFNEGGGGPEFFPPKNPFSSFSLFSPIFTTSPSGSDSEQTEANF